MEVLTNLKNRYWLLILPVLLFLTRYHFYFGLRIPALERAGREHPMTFQSFLVFNYLLGVILMFLFLFFNFLLLKGIAYLWQNLESKKLLKAILISYCVFFIPGIISSLYFTLINADFQSSELGAFDRAFYLKAETGMEDLFDSNVTNTILSSVSLMEFAYFAVMVVALQFLFEDLSMKKIVPIVLILACVHFGSKMIIPLMMA